MKISEIDFSTIPETNKLYDSNPYDTSFVGNVLFCEKENDNGYLLILDQTLFFPEEGGQTPDTGTIIYNGSAVKVTDVRVKKIHGHDWIIHIIDNTINNGIPVGCSVSGEINWEHRYSNMQNHSGEHIFSGLVNSLLGYDNVGFHLSDNIVTMDYNGPLSEEDIDNISLKANEAIWTDLRISAEYPEKDILDSMQYRSKIQLEGPVRIVTIPGIDTCACCAPHVKRTGEIGSLMVISSQNYKGGTRLSILCGKRAYLYNVNNRNMITAISQGLKIPPDETVKGVSELQDSISSLKKTLHQATAEILSLDSKLIPADSDNAILFVPEADSISIRNFINENKNSHSGYVGVFSGDDNTGYSYIIGSSSKDCQKLLSTLRNDFSSKGGGKPEMIQGSLNAAKELILDAIQGE
jgi:alanyl-tRNA synthetase